MKRCTRKRGFTLLELLVATAITAVLAALLITITTGVMDVWNRSRGSLTTANQVKLALDQIAVDLEGAIIRNDGNTWFASTVLETPTGGATTSEAQFRDDRGWEVKAADWGRVKPQSDSGRSNFDERGLKVGRLNIEDCTFGRGGVWLRFVTTEQGSNADVSTLAAPTVVSYQLSRREVTSESDGDYAYMLFRSAVRTTGEPSGQSAGTFQLGYDLDPDLEGSMYADPSGYEGNPGNVLKPNVNQALAVNVIDFGLRLYVRVGGELRLIFPAKSNGAPTDAPEEFGIDNETISASREEWSHLVSSRYSFNPLEPYRHVAPEVAEIMVRVLTDEGAQMIQALEAGKLSGSWWDIAMAHSRVYTRRVEIKGRPL